MNNKYILEYLYYYKIKNYQTNHSGLEKKNNYQITNECSNITECYQISNECCKNINKFRQYQRTNDEKILVGFEITNKKRKIIRFAPRNITIITKQR